MTHSAVQSVLAYRSLPRAILRNPEAHLGCFRVLQHCREGKTDMLWGDGFQHRREVLIPAIAGLSITRERVSAPGSRFLRHPFQP